MTTSASKSASRVQRAIAWTLLLAAVAVGLLGRVPGVALLLITEVVLALAITGIAVRLGTTRDAGQEPVAVLIIAMMALMMPQSSWGGLGIAKTTSAAIALFASQALWAVHRYPERDVPLRPIASRTKEGARQGAFGGMFLAVIAMITLILELLFGRSTLSQLAPLALTLLPGYILGGLAAGALSGVSRNLLRFPLGALMFGLIGGPIMFGFIMPGFRVLDQVRGKEVGSVASSVGTAIACGMLAGPAAVLILAWKSPKSGVEPTSAVGAA